MKEKTIGFIGAGNMAQAIFGGLLASGVASDRIIASGRDEEKLLGLKESKGIPVTTDNKKVAAGCDVLFLAAKPNQLRAICEQIAPEVAKKSPLIISVAAGVTTDHLTRWLNPKAAIVRCMPNTPSLIQQGVSGLFANRQVDEAAKTLASELMAAVGLVEWVERESLLDAVTALSGCGPAYFFLLMEAMQAAGEQLGLSQETARVLTEQTALGAAAMSQASDVPVSQLRKNVTSKGGCTAEALAVFEKSRLRDIVMQAMQAADARSLSLSKEME